MSPGWNFLGLTLELYLRDMLCFAAASWILLTLPFTCIFPLFALTQPY